MKETRFFYVPDAADGQELPQGEALHALRVLRLQTGDEMMLMDGRGNYYRAEVTLAHTHHCNYAIREVLPQQRQWRGRVCLAIAPTKMMERMEWMLEKTVEIGVDELTFLSCQFSERRVVKIQRLEKIAVSAVKQSRKAWMPELHGMTDFKRFIQQPFQGNKYIAHCYEEIPRAYLFDELRKTETAGQHAASVNMADAIVMIGPEGDFSIDEVRQAMDAGFVSVHLGESRLRTETAGLMAVTMMQLSKN